VDLVRVGVIGCGWIGQNTHVPVLLENSKAKLVAICDRDEVLLGRVGDKYGMQNRFCDYIELLESGLVDAVSICTPTATHSEIALASTKAGIHVLCEKPLASNLREAQLIVDARVTNMTDTECKLSTANRHNRYREFR
jgi:predicted dehydrogenase